MNISTAHNHGARKNRNDLSVGKQISKKLHRQRIVFIPKLRNHNSPVCDIKIHIAGCQSLTGTAHIFALFKDKSGQLLLGNTDRFLWNQKLMHLKFSSFGIRLLLQHAQRFMTQLPLRILLIFCPCQNDLSGLYKRTDIIHMLIRLILINASRKPDDFLCTKISLQSLFDFCFAHLRISSTAQKTSLCDQHRSLSVRMNRTAFQHKVLRIIAVHAQLFANLRCCKVVFFPVCIQSVPRSAPGIELPVNSSDSSLVIDDASWSDISRPGIVRLNFQNLNRRTVRKNLPHLYCILRRC